MGNHLVSRAEKRVTSLSFLLQGIHPTHFALPTSRHQTRERDLTREGYVQSRGGSKRQLAPDRDEMRLRVR